RSRGRARRMRVSRRRKGWDGSARAHGARPPAGRQDSTAAGREAPAGNSCGDGGGGSSPLHYSVDVQGAAVAEGLVPGFSKSVASTRLVSSFNWAAVVIRGCVLRLIS